MTPVLKFASMRVVAATSAAVLLAASSLAAPVATAAPGSVAGMIVFLDPGHNGANDASITRQVSNGRGGTKDHKVRLARCVCGGVGGLAFLY